MLTNTLTNTSIKGYLYLQDAVCRLKDDVRGATLIEYSVLIGLMTVAVIVTVGLVGDWISTTWTDLEDNLTP